MDLTKLTGLPLTYPEVGATREVLPDGYHHIEATARIGDGRDRCEQAGQAVLHWGMQRGAGLRVQASSDVAAVDAVVVVRLGLLPAPCRVVYVVEIGDDANRCGFGYGHPARAPGVRRRIVLGAL